MHLCYIITARHTSITYAQGGICHGPVSVCHPINQSIKTNLYSALRRRRIRGACWTRL